MCTEFPCRYKKGRMSQSSHWRQTRINSEQKQKCVYFPTASSLSVGRSFIFYCWQQETLPWKKKAWKWIERPRSIQCMRIRVWWGLPQRCCANFDGQVTVTTEFCTVATSICGFSVCSFLHVTILAPRHLKYLCISFLDSRIHTLYFLLGIRFSWRSLETLRNVKWWCEWAEFYSCIPRVRGALWIESCAQRLERLTDIFRVSSHSLKDSAGMQ